MEIATLMFLVRQEPRKCKKVLLGIKKLKVGKGKWNAPGGHFESGDKSVLDRAILETVEESTVEPSKKSTKLKAIVHCFREDKPYFDVHVFECDKWAGRPAETQEMGPFVWHHVGNLPTHRMMEGDAVWVSEVLKNSELKEVWIYYDENMKLLDYRIKTVDSL